MARPLPLRKRSHPAVCTGLSVISAPTISSTSPGEHQGPVAPRPPAAPVKRADDDQVYRLAQLAAVLPLELDPQPSPRARPVDAAAGLAPQALAALLNCFLEKLLQRLGITDLT